MGTLVRETRHAFRMLLRQPGFTAGETRLHALAASLAGASADAVRHAVVDAALAWCDGTPPHDDLTVVAARVV